ncbi:MAG: hypothetical protein ACKN82_20975 [Pirellula sp.]
MLWFVACGLIGFSFYWVFGMVLESPDWVLTIVIGLISLAILSGVATALAFVEFSDEAITQRFLMKRKIPWSEMTEWTQWGTDGSFYVRTVSGKVFGFSQWCIFGTRNEVVHSLLTHKLGPETKGDNAVSIDITRFLFGSFILDPKKDETSKR